MFSTCKYSGNGKLLSFEVSNLWRPLCRTTARMKYLRVSEIEQGSYLSKSYGDIVILVVKEYFIVEAPDPVKILFGEEQCRT